MRSSTLLLVFALIAATALGGCLRDLQDRLDGDVSPLDYLRDSDYKRWVVEVDYVAGHRPDAAVTDMAKARVAPLVHKPGGFDFVASDSIPETGTSWTTQALVDLSSQYLDQETRGDTVVTHLIYVDGHSAADSNEGRVLGVTIGFDLIVIFSQTIKDTCRVGAIPPCGVSVNELLGAVTVHEFGHALGLVDREAGGHTPVPKQSDHEDPEHPGHSKNSRSVMYWAVESSLFARVLSGPLPTQFDAADKQDLCAAGGRC